MDCIRLTRAGSGWESQLEGDLGTEGQNSPLLALIPTTQVSGHQISLPPPSAPLLQPA